MDRFESRGITHAPAGAVLAAARPPPVVGPPAPFPAPLREPRFACAGCAPAGAVLVAARPSPGGWSLAPFPSPLRCCRVPEGEPRGHRGSRDSAAEPLVSGLSSAWVAEDPPGSWPCWGSGTTNQGRGERRGRPTTGRRPRSDTNRAFGGAHPAQAKRGSLRGAGDGASKHVPGAAAKRKEPPPRERRPARCGAGEEEGRRLGRARTKSPWLEVSTAATSAPQPHRKPRR